MKSTTKVAVDRQVLESGNDVFEFMDKVMNAVKAKIDLFGATDIWNLCPEEVHLEWLIVENHGNGKYYLATLATNEQGELFISSVAEVRKQWVTMDEPSASEGTVQRSEAKTLGPSDLVMTEVQRGSPSIWSGLLW